MIIFGTMRPKLIARMIISAVMPSATVAPVRSGGARAAGNLYKSAGRPEKVDGRERHVRLARDGRKNGSDDNTGDERA
jgi:hypothetical protein